MSKRYLIDLDEKQLRALQKACECFSRVSTGQLRYALDEAWMEKIFSLSMEKTKELEDLLQKVTLILSDGELDGFRGSFGIYSTDINPYAATSFGILQVIRHQFWKEQPKDKRSNMTVDSSVHVIGEKAIKVTSYEKDKDDLPSVFEACVECQFDSVPHAHQCNSCIDAHGNLRNFAQKD